MERPEPAVDARALRFEHSVVALCLLAGFVFDLPAVIPVLAVLLGVGAAFGARADVLGRLYARLLAPRLGPDPRERATVARFGRLVAVAVLSIATAVLAVGIEGLAWAVVLLLAFVDAVAATTGFNAVAVLHDRLVRRRHG